MASVTIGLGALLVALGLGGYFGSKRVSKTALIPAFFGLPILGLGVAAALCESCRSGSLYGATALAILGFLGSARGLPGAWNLMAGRPVPRPAAAIAQSVMAALCLAYTVLAVWTFLTAP
ncbi:MAG: hypothetical protein IT429_08500 [Gemmataceae bacterium]|nr:hypothetical protein [Gemmataceae bacterium]